MMVVSALLLWATSVASGQIVIQIPGAANIPLALPHPQQPGGAAGGSADQVWQAVHMDLETSGYFEIQDPGGYVEKDGAVEPGTFDFDAWMLLRTTVLVKTRVWPSGDANCDPGGTRMCADVFVYHVPSGAKLAARRFRGAPTSARHLGHAIANAVLEATTGTKGWFGSRLVAVGKQSGHKEIYLLDSDGYGVDPVTRNGTINLSPAWSPDGREIAWTSYKKANPDLYVKDLVTGRTRTLSNVKGVNTSADFAPDGKTLALARSVEGDSDLFLLDARTGEQVRRLTVGGGIDVSPDFTPDGATIAFASERSGGSQIYVTSTAGGDARRVTFTGDFNVDPVVSPDGTKIAYVGRSQGGFDLYVCDLDGRNTIRLTQDMADNEDPSWSPDSKYLVFSSTRTGKSDLWITTADGRHQTRVTTTGGWTQPSWMPGAR
jgi:TolB protein